ncbi:hypothetical protein [Polyangium jinanense]|uniref:Lipoprotein n=1 Tax=Polyangium jinanense TaxID=2829994 RepID=A0A9X3XD51_9BACT|nr:hypothetical protein [Polyangium jinanense]MDC3961175.1 hypothetical protein [Polyangium jinanense]MDC3986478.1 hypothetical protein [Polyangium jinanense]
MTRIPMHSLSLLFALVALGCQNKQESPEKAPAQEAPETKPSTTKPREKRAARPVQEYPAAESFALKPLAVGQWIRFAVESKGVPPSQVFVRIVGKEGEAFWYEIEANTPTGTTISQFLVENAASKGFDKNAIRKMRTKADTGPVQEQTEPRDAILKAAESVEEFAAILNPPPDFAKVERKEAKVTAGLFQGCFVYEAEHEEGGVKTKETVFRHPAVPITGFVRSEGTRGSAAVTKELLELHESGARSAL